MRRPDVWWRLVLYKFCWYAAWCKKIVQNINQDSLFLNIVQGGRACHIPNSKIDMAIPVVVCGKSAMVGKPLADILSPECEGIALFGIS